jgi:hypothetical protein
MWARGMWDVMVSDDADEVANQATQLNGLFRVAANVPHRGESLGRDLQATGNLDTVDLVVPRVIRSRDRCRIRRVCL